MLVTLRMTSDVGPNLRGEIASFPPSQAELLKSKRLGFELARFDETTHRFDVETGAPVPLEVSVEPDPVPPLAPDTSVADDVLVGATDVRQVSFFEGTATPLPPLISPAPVPVARAPAPAPVEPDPVPPPAPTPAPTPATAPLPVEPDPVPPPAPTAPSAP